MESKTTVTTVTVKASGAIVDNIPLLLHENRQGPRIEYLPTSEYKLKKGDNTGWGVRVQYTSRSQKEVNAIYVGGYDDRQAQGYGEWHSQESNISYHGGWKDNFAEGYGVYTDSWSENWPNDWVKFLPGDADSEMRVQYEGGFKNGYFHGYGVLTFKDTSKFEGTFKEGRRHGYGRYVRRNGEVVEWQIEGAIKVDVKKEKEKNKKKDDEKPQNPQPNQPQVIVVQPTPAAAPSNAPGPQYVLVGPNGQPVLQASAASAHESNIHGSAGVNFSLGHQSQHQGQFQLQQPQGYYYQPVQGGFGSAVELPPRAPSPHPQYVQPVLEMPPRPVTPIPVQYLPARPVTPQGTPGHGRTNSQGFIWAPPPQPQIPPPYPLDGTDNPQPSPSSTQYLSQM
jgi:hypothetical protein